MLRDFGGQGVVDEVGATTGPDGKVVWHEVAGEEVGVGLDNTGGKGATETAANRNGP